jgi:hypothetical protein
MLWFPAEFIAASDGSAVTGSGCGVDRPVPGSAVGAGAGAGAVVAEVDGLGVGVADGEGVGVGVGVGAAVVTGAGVSTADALKDPEAPVARPAMRASEASPVTAVRRNGRIGLPFKKPVLSATSAGHFCQCW